MHVCDPICLGRSCGSMDLFLSKPEKSQTDAFLNLSVALFHLSCSFVFACLYVRTHREVEGEGIKPRWKQRELPTKAFYL